jgi:tetratricopeptide (TPR) repeat protein
MKRVKMIVAIAVTFFAATNASAQTANDVIVKYNEAATLIKAKNYAAAIPLLETTVELGLAVGNEEALNIVQQAQNYLPTCYCNAGLALCNERKFTEAIQYLNKAANLSELYGDTSTGQRVASLLGKTYYIMGVDAFNANDFTKAIEMFALGYEANPTNTQLGLALAESYANSGDLDNGMRVYSEIAALETRHSRFAEAAKEAKSKMAEYMTIEASKMAKSGNIDEAYALIDRILAVDAENATALFLRLQWASNAKQYANVIKWGEQAAIAQTNPELKSTAYFLLGMAYQNSEKFDEAITQYGKVTDGQYVSTAKTQIAEIRKVQANKR